MTHTATRAAIYLRQSLDATGEGLAVDRQRADCRKIARQRGWKIVGEFVDNSISASDARKARPGYSSLVEAFGARQFDALICYDLDRLTRQPRQLEDWIDAAEHRGLLLVTVDRDTDLTTDNGRTFARIKLAVARGEVDRKSARQRRAAQQRHELGRPPMGVRLTGYTPGGTVIEREATVVRAVFDRFASGDSLRGIAAWLGEQDVRPRHGGAWTPSSVRSMLTNSRYAGRSVLRTKVRNDRVGRVEDVTLTGNGTWAPIIDGALFDVVATRLADPRRRTQVGTDRKHLGASLYRCGVCNTPVRSFSSGRYRCPNACVIRSRGPVDAYVLAVLRGRLARPDLADLLHVEDTDRARELAAEVDRLRARLTRIENDYDADVIDGRRYATAHAKVTAELGQALTEQARTNGHGAISGIVADPDPVAAFDAAPLMIQRAVLDVLVQVRLHPAPRGRRTFDPATVEITAAQP